MHARNVSSWVGGGGIVGIGDVEGAEGGVEGLGDWGGRWRRGDVGLVRLERLLLRRGGGGLRRKGGVVLDGVTGVVVC